MEASWVIGGISIIINLLILNAQSGVRAEIAGLRAHVYERFITKDDLVRLTPK